MDEGLTLNLDLEELGAARRGPKLTWKEKKQLKRQRQQQRGRKADTPGVVVAKSAIAPAAAVTQQHHAPSAPAAAGLTNGSYRPQLQQAQATAAHAAKPVSQQPLKRKRASSPDGLDAADEADLMALVAFNLGREQQLLEEDPGLARHAAAEAAATAEGGTGLPGVVEFGEAEDEVDYRQLSKRLKNAAGRAAAGSAAPAAREQRPGRNAPSSSAAAAGRPAKQQQKQRQVLQQHKVGQLAHAETAVPAEARVVLFGEAPATPANPSGAPPTWEDLGVVPLLADHLAALNFTAPTKVQQAAMPVLLGGRDALVRSPTGSGKTLAYLVPLVQQLQAAQPKIQRADGTYAVILAPTRELALQISDVLTALLRRFCWLVGGLLIGGENRGHEKARLRKGVTVVVATPGRIIDHLENTNSFKVERCRHLIVDEADRLLDLGFEAKLRSIAETLAQRSTSSSESSKDEQARQTVMISATLHPGLQALANISMTNPVAVGFSAQQLAAAGAAAAATAAAAAGDGEADGSTDRPPAAPGAAAGGQDEFSIPAQLLQQYVEVPARLRLVALIGALRSRARRSSASKVVVFFSSCTSVDFHHALLTRPISLSAGQPGSEGLEAGAGQLLVPGVLKLHGDMPQKERTSAFLTFSQASSGVLLCTDVAARGLDFPAVTCIIQYDAAGEPSEYVHRVGRTARMGHKGEALLFMLPSERGYISLLESQSVALTQLQLPALCRCLPDVQAASMMGKAAAKNMRRAPAGAPGEEEACGEYAGAAAMLQRALVRTVGADPELKQQAQAAFRSFVGAYSVHPKHLKSIFSVRSLHLGHVAGSFGLAEAPTAIGGSGSAAAARKAKQQKARAGKGEAAKAMRKAAYAAMRNA